MNVNALLNSVLQLWKRKNQNVCNKIYNVKIYSVDRKTKTTLSSFYSCSFCPFELADFLAPDDTRSSHNLYELLFNYENKKIDLLIGLNRPDIFRSLEVIYKNKQEPNICFGGQ